MRHLMRDCVSSLDDIDQTSVAFMVAFNEWFRDEIEPINRQIANGEICCKCSNCKYLGKDLKQVLKALKKDNKQLKQDIKALKRLLDDLDEFENNQECDDAVDRND